MGSSFFSRLQASLFDADDSSDTSSLASSPPGTPQHGSSSLFIERKVVLGICALERKARSKPMAQIIEYVVEITRGMVQVIYFEESMILKEGGVSKRLSLTMLINDRP
jgi:hypothetical protein